MNFSENILGVLVRGNRHTAVRKHPVRVLAVLGLLCLSQLMYAQSLPADVSPTCIVTPPQFAGWFANNTVTLNGVVNPANGITFVPNSNCSFYQWSEQMFLWLNSPAPVSYGGGARIFDSPTFFDVSPLNASNQRTFIPHTPGIIRPFPLPIRAAQVGSHGLQVIFDKAGRMLEVQPAQIAPSGKQLILNSAGKQVEIERATIENGKAVFLDKANKRITGAKPILQKSLLDRALEAIRVNTPTAKIPLPSKSSTTLVVQRFMIGGHPIFIDPFGNPDPVEEGQAGTDDVLETQNGSLVYYSIAVNDVYAYFLTGAKTGGITPFPPTFPTTMTSLVNIVNYALTKGKIFADPDALAIEVKSSWVEASTLPNTGDYITMSAIIPVYTPNANSTTWTPTGATKTVTLAMVGMHVVGSVAGHPEMIWATFEHGGNTPLATYTYDSTTGVKTVNQSTAGTWLFAANGAGAPFNAAHMHVSGANIQALPANPPAPPPPFTISASNTIRWKPFGAATDVIPLNLTVSSPTAANTDIISINNSVRGMLVGGDIRGNYIMSGATWTLGGAAPTFDTATPPANNSNQVGTSFLTNSTMETYDQGIDTTQKNGGTNCFDCHNGAGTANPLSPNVPDGLSHIFSVLQPLP